MEIPGIGMSFLMIGVIFSQISLITVSTLSYPMSTILVILSSFDLMTNITLTCASATQSMVLAKAALALSLVCFIKSVSLFGVSLFIEYGQLEKILKNFIAQEIGPQAMRLIVVVTGTIFVVKALLLTCQALKNYWRMKKLGDVIPFSYKLHGLSQPV